MVSRDEVPILFLGVQISRDPSARTMSLRLADLIVARSNQSVVPQVPASISLDDFSRYASLRKKILIGPLGLGRSW